MKEKIYTIPVSEAFKTDCECPMCLLESNLENEYIEYALGPSLMEPDSRVESNENGFCRRHFEMLFNSQTNKLGLGLIIDTMMTEQNKKFKKLCDKGIHKKYADTVVEKLQKFEKKCVICDKIDYTMQRFIDVILYLWCKEPEFKERFNRGKGFCLMHLAQLVEGTKKYMSSKESQEFLGILMDLQLNNLERIQSEVNWFTKKYDYRYNDEPWGNSKDALQRSIQKIVGFCSLK